MLFSYISQVELLVFKLNIKEAYMFGGVIVDTMLGLPAKKNNDVDIAIVGDEDYCNTIHQSINEFSEYCSEVKFTEPNSWGGVYGFWFNFEGQKYDVCFIKDRKQLGVFDIDSVIVSFPDKIFIGLDNAFNELLTGELHPKRSLNDIGPLRYAVRYIKMYAKYNVIPSEDLPELYYAECHKDYAHFLHYLMINLNCMKSKPLTQNIAFLKRVIEPLDNLIYRLCTRYFEQEQELRGGALINLIAISAHSEKNALNCRVNLLKERNDYMFYYS